MIGVPVIFVSRIPTQNKKYVIGLFFTSVICVKRTRNAVYYFFLYLALFNTRATHLASLNALS